VARALLDPACQDGITAADTLHKKVCQTPNLGKTMCTDASLGCPHQRCGYQEHCTQPAACCQDNCVHQCSCACTQNPHLGHVSGKWLSAWEVPLGQLDGLLTVCFLLNRDELNCSSCRACSTGVCRVAGLLYGWMHALCQAHPDGAGAVGASRRCWQGGMRPSTGSTWASYASPTCPASCTRSVRRRQGASLSVAFWTLMATWCCVCTACKWTNS
jgi:hypothetical protein